jgi:hypothetical protein
MPFEHRARERGVRASRLDLWDVSSRGLLRGDERTSRLTVPKATVSARNMTLAAYVFCMTQKSHQRGTVRTQLRCASQQRHGCVLHSWTFPPKPRRRLRAPSYFRKASLSGESRPVAWRDTGMQCCYGRSSTVTPGCAPASSSQTREREACPPGKQRVGRLRLDGIATLRSLEHM